MTDRLGVALGEASTWRGLIALLVLAGVKLDPEQQETIIEAGVAIYALIAIFFKRAEPNV